MDTSLPEIEFPNGHLQKVIIAMKGLPSTGKSEIAMLMGEWARSNVLYIDDFLEAFSSEKGYTAEAMPTTEEADRLLRLAFDGLYKAAARHLGNSNRVVIKSRFCSTFEFDLLTSLIDFCKNFRSNIHVVVIIIEPRVKNEYRWQSRVDKDRDTRVTGDRWYKARTWNDFQKAKEDDTDSQALDFHLLSSLDRNWLYHSRVRRLVLDYFDDAISTRNRSDFLELTPDFKDAILYLLRWNFEGNIPQARYVAKLHFNELSRYLLEQEIRKSRERRKYVCTNSNSRAGSCVFKLREKLPARDVCCNVCEEGVASGQPGYTCHFCFLTLHKSCAEMMPHLDFLNLTWVMTYNMGSQSVCSRYYCKDKGVHSCKSCEEKGEGLSYECESCFYENHLRSGLLPAIINHDCHHLHFLSIHFALKNPIQCKGCGEVRGHRPSPACYVCHLCKFVMI